MKRLLLALLAAGLLFGCGPDNQPDTTNNTPESTMDNTADNASDAGETAMGTADDAATTGKIKSALLADTEIGALDINVDTMDGKVYLKGTVESEAQKAKAENTARDIAGDAYTIENELIVKSDNG